jgi:RnfABCDGE-type electron transport complex B subunit
MEILISVLSLGSLGFLFGMGLAFASERFFVKIDSCTNEIFSQLPGVNCGACGQAGCLGFAEGLSKGICSIEDCKVMEEEGRRKVSQLLGIELIPKVKTKAILHCQGGKAVKDRFIYQGIKDCISANLVLGGQKECIWGCLGFGECEKSCPFGAIKMGEDLLPIIDETKCTGCGKCVEVCPKGLFSLIPIDKKYFVACKSKDFGKKVMEVCPVGCIGCGKCEKVCPLDAIHVINNSATIDYNKCNNCGKCFEVCPTKAIKKC